MDRLLSSLLFVLFYLGCGGHAGGGAEQPDTDSDTDTGEPDTDTGTGEPDTDSDTGEPDTDTISAWPSAAAEISVSPAGDRTTGVQGGEGIEIPATRPEAAAWIRGASSRAATTAAIIHGMRNGVAAGIDPPGKMNVIGRSAGSAGVPAREAARSSCATAAV